MVRLRIVRAPLCQALIGPLFGEHVEDREAIVVAYEKHGIAQYR